MARVSARDFEPASSVMDYIREERERCAALVELMDWSTGDDKQFLLYCINAPWYPDEIDEARKRFGELAPADDFEDLM